MTLRQLLPMVNAKRREEWEHTSALLAMIYNAHSTSGKAVKASDFNPFRKKEEVSMTISRDEAAIIFKQMAKAR